MVPNEELQLLLNKRYSRILDKFNWNLRYTKYVLTY